MKAIKLLKILEELPKDKEIYVYNGNFGEDNSPVKFLRASDVPEYYRKGAFLKLDSIVVFR